MSGEHQEKSGEAAPPSYTPMPVAGESAAAAGTSSGAAAHHGEASSSGTAHPGPHHPGAGEAPAGVCPFAAVHALQPSNQSLHSISAVESCQSAVFAQLPNPPPLQPNSQGFYGPYLKYNSVDYAKGTWSGSVLIASSDEKGPLMTIMNPSNESEVYKLIPSRLDDFMNLVFYRYDIVVPMSTDPSPKKYMYFFKEDRSLPHVFYVCSSQQKNWRWVFHSCNGWSSGVPLQTRQSMGGLEPLWRDMLKKHETNPILLMVGGGDQVYADAVWKLECLRNWLAVRGRSNRLNAEWTPEMERETSQFYVELYLRHWGQPFISEAHASIPSFNAIDDHDLWDGLGSYPDWLENCTVFQNLRRVAMKYYLLFQQQTKVELGVSDGYIGADNPEKKAFTALRLAGHETAITCIDTRSERTQTQICSPIHWNKLQTAINNLPASVKHLIVVTGVPLVYPRMATADTLFEVFGKAKRSTEKAITHITHGVASMIGGMGKLARKAGIKVDKDFEDTVHKELDDFQHNIKAAFGKNGAMKSLVNQFGLPELMDDLHDHWTHKTHDEERTYLISMLQQLSAAKSMRVTFVAGDVHCAGVGRLFNATEPTSTDHHLMYQIVSSAIGNVPPPPAVLNNVNSSAKVLKAGPQNTKEEMIELFKVDVDGKALNKAKLLGRRNYCIIQGAQSVAPAANESLEFCLIVEHLSHDMEPKPYAITVPALV